MHPVMSERPLLFISAVSKEHRSLRSTVADILHQLGYDTDFQDIFGTEQGDITGMLARRVEACDGVLQLVGQRYGFAPPAQHPVYGECSYTQFEALYARGKGMKVWYLLLAPAHPHDPCDAESPERQALQASYRQRIQDDTHIYHQCATVDQTKLRIHEWRNDLAELRFAWQQRMDRMELHTSDSHAMLQRMEKQLEDLAKAKQAEGKQLSDFPREEIIAELARLEGITLAELQSLLAEASASNDLSTRAQALMIEQQFAEAAVLSRKAGDAKAKRLQDLQTRTAALAKEAALDYHREGLAHFYQLQYPLAINAYETALEQITCDSHSGTWAMLQNDLAVALQEQGIRTDPAVGNQHLARAVTAYRAALKVYTREAFAHHWAMTQNNLGLTIQNQGIRSEGQTGLNLLAESVTAYRAALTVYTREALPQLWAMTQNNLAITLQEQGSRSEGLVGQNLLGQAVAAYRASLEVLTREALPKAWAMTQNNMASALAQEGERREGEAGLELLALAVAAFRASQEVCSRETRPQYWAGTQNNIGLALQEQGIRSKGQARLDLLAQAVTAYRGALTVRTRETLPQDWARTQSNMANALLAQGIRSDGRTGLELLQEAVSSYRAALQVHTREALPQDWAQTQNNLGSALVAQGDRALNKNMGLRFYSEAEEAYLAALEVRTWAALPHDHQLTKKNLALVREKMAK